MSEDVWSEQDTTPDAIEARFDELFKDTPDGYVPTWRPKSVTMLITWETQPT